MDWITWRNSGFASTSSCDYCKPASNTRLAKQRHISKQHWGTYRTVRRLGHHYLATTLGANTADDNTQYSLLTQVTHSVTVATSTNQCCCCCGSVASHSKIPSWIQSRQWNFIFLSFCIFCHVVIAVSFEYNEIKIASKVTFKSATNTAIIPSQQPQPFYGHYTGQPALAGTSS